jgi:hypothetical protein
MSRFSHAIEQLVRLLPTFNSPLVLGEFVIEFARAIAPSNKVKRRNRRWRSGRFERSASGHGNRRDR